MRLFDTEEKVGLFLDSVGHGVEKRPGEEVKVLKLTLRATPFSADLAGTMADGIKPTLFQLSTSTPKARLRRADFGAGDVDRQLITIYASPDTEQPSLALDQVKVHHIAARMAKDRTDFDLLLKVSFGPAGRQELEYIQNWLLTQRFCVFQAAEPGFDFEEDGEDADLTDADEKARVVLPPPMWDDDAAPDQATADDSPATTAAKRSVGVNRKLHSHQAKRRGRRQAEAEA